MVRIHGNMRKYQVRFRGGLEQCPERSNKAMDVERHTLLEGVDAWEGEMTCQGITYMVEAIQKDNQTWQMEVLIRGRGCSFLGKQIGTVQPLHYGVYPTLQAALDAAADYIRGLNPEAGSIQKG